MPDTSFLKFNPQNGSVTEGWFVCTPKQPFHAEVPDVAYLCVMLGVQTLNGDVDDHDDDFIFQSIIKSYIFSIIIFK